MVTIVNKVTTYYKSPQLGLWTFLAAEILFFGGVFTSNSIHRQAYSTLVNVVRAD